MLRKKKREQNQGDRDKEKGKERKKEKEVMFFILQTRVMRPERGGHVLNSHEFLPCTVNSMTISSIALRSFRATTSQR